MYVCIVMDYYETGTYIHTYIHTFVMAEFSIVWSRQELTGKL